MRCLQAITVIFIFGIIACDQPAKGRNGVIYKSAAEYNDYIVSHQSKLIQHVLDLEKAAENNLDSAEKMLDKYITETATMVEEIKGMPVYKGDSSLRNAAVGSFRFYKKVFQNDYKRIIHIRKKEAEMTREDIEEVKKIIDKITRDEEGIDKSFHNAQKNFADNNNMKLMGNKMKKKFDKGKDK